MSRSLSRGAAIRAMHADLQTYLPCDLLAKVDVMSMAHGLECRSPFLDHKLVEFAVSIPFQTLVRGKTDKPLLTSTFADLIPPPLRMRGKMGFCIPLDRCFRTDFRHHVEDMLLGERAIGRGYFREQTVRKLLEQHQSGRWNHSNRNWSLLCLEMWHRTFIDCYEAPTTSLSAESIESTNIMMLAGKA